MKRLRKISLILTAAFVLTSLGFPVHGENVPLLPSCFTDKTEAIGTQMPFKPGDKYGSMQNPPDFTWPKISGAVSYDLQVLDESGAVKYSKEDIKNSYYNFSNTFEPGTYYWQVRYSNGSAYSEWSAKRRFRVDPDASVFTVLDIDTIAAKVPNTHPRIYFTQDTIGEFKNYAKTASNVKVLERMISASDSYILELSKTENGELSDIEKFNDPEVSEATSVAASMTARARIPALTYILTGKEEYKDYAIKALMHMCTWQYTDTAKEDGTYYGTSFKGQDQAFFEVMMGSSMAYDWLYNEMTEAERETARTMISGRFDRVKDSSISVLRRTPYDSHIWSYFGYYGTACIALMHDVEGADGYFKEMLSLYLANVPPMSTEDGGWSKGTAYWTYAFSRDKWFMDILAEGGYINVYNKAWAQNEYLWQMYMYPANSYGSFGDESNFSKPGTSHIMGLAKLAKYTDNPVAVWSKNEIGSVSDTAGLQFDSILFAEADEMEEKAPTEYPRAYTFKDQGMTAMHSSLTSRDRISLYFRSGKYGSYNHMHADQNSFMIEAFGERLAIKSGFYDSYHSTHDSGFTRATYAHNSITFNGGTGQLDDSMDANGNTEAFVTTNDFDAVTGNATKAYNGGINKFLRSIIYIRPGIYVVIDDLEAKTGETASFEWALNAPSDTMSVKNSAEAIITNGQATLEAKIQYPSDITNTGLIQNYEDLNGNEYPPNERYASRAPQDRVYFKTSDTENTKIIATMNVHRTTENASEISKTETDDYMTLTAYGTTVVVNKKGEASEVTYGDVTFKGKAAVYNDESIMLVGGTSLYFAGKKVFDSEKEITAAAGRGELSVSCDDDYVMYVGKENKFVPENVTSTDIKELNVSKLKKRELSALIGISASDAGGEIKLTADKGHYKLLMDENTIISTDELVPVNLYAVKNDDGKVKISWDASNKIESIDLKINGILYENAENPFYITDYPGEILTASIRGKKGNLCSDWSEVLKIHLNLKESASYTELKITDASGNYVTVPEKGGYASAVINLKNFSGENRKLILAQYNSSGILSGLSFSDIPVNTDAEEIINSPLMKVEENENIIKAFIFDMKNLKPLVASASSAVTSAKLSGITLDGEALSGFDPEKTEYEITLGSDGLVPVVKGVADNSVYVTALYETADGGGASAKIFTEARGGESKVYTVSFTKSTADAVLPVSDFKFIYEGYTFENYCAAVGAEQNLTELPTKKITNNYKLMNFVQGGNLCGANDQRKLTMINKRLGLENTLFLGNDAGLSQEASSAPWIVSAFYGKEYTITDETSVDYGKSVDFSKTTVPWFSIKINKDCEAIVLSSSRIPKFEEDSEWRYVKLTEEPYHAIRYYDTTKYPPNKYTQTDVNGYRNMYIRKCTAGETLQLYNENTGSVAGIPYFTFFRF